MPTEMILSEEAKQALNSALEQSETAEQLLTNLNQTTFGPGQCSPHGSKCKGLAIEYMLINAQGNKREILLELLSEPDKGLNLISALHFE